MLFYFVYRYGVSRHDTVDIFEVSDALHRLISAQYTLKSTSNTYAMALVAQKGVLWSLIMY